MSEQVCITGLACATPLGNTFDEVADNLLAGKSGVRQWTGDSSTASRTWIAGCVDEIPTPVGWDDEQFSQLSRFEQLTLWCSVQSLQDAQCWDQRMRMRVGVSFGFGGEWLRIWELDGHQGGRRVYEPHHDREPMTGYVQRNLGITGPAVTVAAACASGNYALAQGRRLIELGLADICLAGSCDIVTPMSLAGFDNLRALSRRTDDPPAASRPYDCGRDGFVIAEGGVIFVLESATSAKRRGARIYGEFVGFGASSDASHLIIPSSDPAPAAVAIRMAMRDAHVTPDEIDYLNAHATGTPVGDRAETDAVKLAFGDAASRVPVSSTKSMTGHLISAAAVIEALACLVAFDRQAIPPTINLENPDPECDLCHVAQEARQQPVRVAASNSFGFGGSNTCLILRKAA